MDMMAALVLIIALFAVLGTAAFVNEVFEREQTLRKRFGEKRTSGARRMRGADWGELRVLRDLQKDVMGP